MPKYDLYCHQVVKHLVPAEQARRALRTMPLDCRFLMKERARAFTKPTAAVSVAPNICTQTEPYALRHLSMSLSRPRGKGVTLRYPPYLDREPHTGS